MITLHVILLANIHYVFLPGLNPMYINPRLTLSTQERAIKTISCFCLVVVTPTWQAWLWLVVCIGSALKVQLLDPLSYAVLLLHSIFTMAFSLKTRARDQPNSEQSDSMTTLYRERPFYGTSGKCPPMHVIINYESYVWCYISLQAFKESPNLFVHSMNYQGWPLFS